MIPSLATSLATAGFVFAMVYAGIVDLTTMRIRNGLVLALLGAYLVLAMPAGFTLEEIAWSAAIAAGLLAVSFVFFARGWMGGGDAKLLAVTALWLGLDHAPAFLVYTALFGGALTLAILQLRLVGLPAFLGSKPWITRLQSDRTGIPYGVAITLAALIVFPQTRWFAL
jgi:prepilin peptidase CpaA